MGNELRYVCLVETRRLLLLMGVVFGLILFVQYFELPYGNVLSSVFETSKSQGKHTDNFPIRDSSSNPTASNLTQFSRNTMDLNVSNGAPTTVEASDRMDGSAGNVKDEFPVDSGKTLNYTSGDDFGLENGKPPNDAFGDDFVLGSGTTLNDTFGDDFTRQNGKIPNDTLGENLPPQSRNETFDDEIDPEDEIPLKDSLEMGRDSTIDTALGKDIGDGIGDTVQTSERNEEEEISKAKAPLVSESSSGLVSPLLAPQNPQSNQTSLDATTEQGSAIFLEKSESPNIPKADHSDPVSDTAISIAPATKGRLIEPEPAVVPISKMNDLLVQSHLSYRTPKIRWSSPADQELQNAKSLIENVPFVQNDPQFDVSLFRNFSAFKRSYELMEQTLKVYIYAEGERPIFHQPPLKGIYASEGWFMKLLKGNKKFLTKNPKKAHLFYLPFSSRMLEVALYVPDSHDRKPLIDKLSNYVQTISTKHNFWNRTGGADHFLVACHDWAPAETRQVMANCIRSLCNADVKEGFRFGKDASLPETYIQKPQNPLRQLGGKPPSQRRILAFFAGNMHGYLRPILLNQWQDKDPEMKIFGQIQKVKGEMSYAQYMKSSKYCICARGFEVNSPRVVEAIFYECVPVIISDNFIPPFFETLNWESFAVFVLEKDIPDLKKILQSISMRRYVEMQRRVKKVQRHFLWHPRPVKYDVFHMVLHSIWYSRVFQTRS